MAKQKKTAAKKAEPIKQKPYTKAQIVAKLAEKAELSKKDATAALDALADVIKDGLAESDSFTLPGLVKIEKQWVPEKPGQKGLPDPFHPGETIDRPAKPAHWKIKVKMLKGLKEIGADFPAE